MVDRPHDRRLSLKDIAIMVGLLTGVAAIFGWVHAEVTIPKILNKVNEIVNRETEPLINEREFSRILERLFARIDSLEETIRENGQ